MTNLISTLKDRVHKRVAYQRTVAELRALPLDVALDLDLHREDAERIAAKAVYGF